MTTFSRIKNLFNSEPAEQVLGYALSELLQLFPNPAVNGLTGLLNAYPKISSLEHAGVHAVYAMLLLDKSDIGNFLELVDGRFVLESTRQFQDTAVKQYKSINANKRLCFLVVDEFKGHVVKFVTHSLDFLGGVDQCHFAPPPPWIVFEGYNPLWWGRPMQGAQGYYDDNFFAPFFLSLGTKQKKSYYQKYALSPDWDKALALFYDADGDD